MYPYKITWATEILREAHEHESYGYADDLSGIKNTIYQYMDVYIDECRTKIEREIADCGTVTLHQFFEMVNSEPYFDCIFLSIKYFDFVSKRWVDYDVNEVELEQYFLSKITN